MEIKRNIKKLNNEKEFRELTSRSNQKGGSQMKTFKEELIEFQNFVNKQNEPDREVDNNQAQYEIEESVVKGCCCCAHSTVPTAVSKEKINQINEMKLKHDLEIICCCGKEKELERELSLLPNFDYNFGSSPNTGTLSSNLTNTTKSVNNTNIVQDLSSTYNLYEKEKKTKAVKKPEILKKETALDNQFSF